MLKIKVTTEATMLSFSVVVLLLVSISTRVSAKVENSFQNSQYSYKDYYGSTPGYQYPDLTVKSSSAGGDASNAPSLVESQPSDPLLSQGTAQHSVGAVPQNQHVYYYETYPMQDTSRRNTYGVPGGGNKRCVYSQNGNMRCYSRQDSYGAASFNDYDTTGGDGDSAGGLGGLAGLIGLLGLKGLKGLATVIGPLIFPLLLPLLFPLLLPLLLLLAIPILLFPIPVISIPAAGAGRGLLTEFSEARKMASNAFERVVSSDECIERISCEISRLSQKRKAGEWIEKALNMLPESSPITKRIFKGFNMMNQSTTEAEGKTQQHSSCFRLKCRMLNIFTEAPVKSNGKKQTPM